MSALTSANRAIQALNAGAFSPGVLDALDGLSRGDRTDDLENALLRVLATTADPRMRNAAAVALADLGSEIAPSVIRGLLVSPPTEGCRGTLLYALREMGGRLPLGLIVSSLARNVGEAQEELLGFLEGGLVEPASEAERAGAVDFMKRHLERAPSASQRAIWEDALALVSDLETS